MAKAKKSATSKQTKSTEKSTAPAAPMIDTAAAAAAAAAMVAGGITSATPAASGNHKESSLFKQMKQGMNKPTLGGVLDKGGNQSKKSGAPFGHGFKQVGHNQTFGADVNRTGVPRRTGG